MAAVIGTGTLGYLIPLGTVLSPSIVDCSGAKVLVQGFHSLFFNTCFSPLAAFSFPLAAQAALCSLDTLQV